MPKHDTSKGSTPYPEEPTGGGDRANNRDQQRRGPITHGSPGSGKGIDIKPENPI